tara:strand:+ start:8912 stop:9397 length:486 start_codon:yes stop_codon:yes gene_type:complete
MTNLALQPFGDVFDKFSKSFIGSDSVYDNMHKLHDDLTKNIPNYPPYNIRKVEDNKYVIELALAGFAKQDLEIILEENRLKITGKTVEDSSENFLFKGIANRTFTRSFALDEQVEVKDAEMLNGLLKVFLERIIPEHKKPRKIDVRDETSDVASSKKIEKK